MADNSLEPNDNAIQCTANIFLKKYKAHQNNTFVTFPHCLSLEETPKGFQKKPKSARKYKDPHSYPRGRGGTTGRTHSDPAIPQGGIAIFSKRPEKTWEQQSLSNVDSFLLYN